ncbi:MAG TPA: HAMP domain-containing methyl-accepting chemotaxis protein [Candidatus Baltobacteraceae bacterium]|nr:HAMP domain-containing methyl-accepting chemotaxis protein [Candidatus Baltobacteraceae bacterium]
MKFRIGAQLTIGFAVPSLLIAVMAAVAYYSMTQMMNTNDSVQKVASIEAAGRDYVAQRTAERLALRNILLWGRQSDFDAADLAVSEMEADTGIMQAEVQGEPDIMKTVRRIALLAVQIAKRYDIELGAARKNREEAFKSFRDDSADIAKEAQLTQRLDDQAKSRLGALGLADTYHTAIIAVTIALAVALACAVLIAGTLAGRITKRLERVRGALNEVVVDDVAKLTGAFQAMAVGDLTASFTSNRAALKDRGQDEISDLAATYNDLADALGHMSAEFAGATERLGNLIRNVQDASSEVSAASSQMTHAAGQSESALQIITKNVDGVAAGARTQSERLAEASMGLEEVSQSSSQIAAGAAYQADSVQAAADAVGEMNQQISGLANLGEELAVAARDAALQTETGSAAVRIAAEALQTLREHTNGTESAMQVLEQRSIAVGEILSAIDEIADQTNLLALNAAIEAARAGDHGRGFAVVADEIRKLAERASGSTKEIGTILIGIRADTDRVSQAMHSSSGAMHNGIERAEHAASALRAVETSIETTKHAAEEMAVRAEQMKASSILLTENLNSVSSVVGENAAATNQMTQTLSSLTAAIAPVAELALDQSAATQAVSASIVELAAQLEQMTSTASYVQNHSGVMRSVSEKFRVGEGTLHSLPALPARPAEENWGTEAA